MNLGQLIDKLESLPGELNLRIAGPCGIVPADVDSYRGYYEDLAISFEMKYSDTTIASFLPMLRGAVGATFTGYKGGEYTMDRGTRVWVSAYGSASGAEVSGVEHDKYNAWITLTMEKW